MRRSAHTCVNLRIYGDSKLKGDANFINYGREAEFDRAPLRHEVGNLHSISMLHLRYFVDADLLLLKVRQTSSRSGIGPGLVSLPRSVLISHGHEWNSS